jgi:methylmalonyl-CoA/ethylmalonyl-CoA epimerase
MLSREKAVVCITYVSHVLGFSAEIPFLQEQGAVLLSPPQPGEAFKNHEIAFLMTKNNLNVELIATKEKQGWLGED